MSAARDYHDDYLGCRYQAAALPPDVRKAYGLPLEPLFCSAFKVAKPQTATSGSYFGGELMARHEGLTSFVTQRLDRVLTRRAQGRIKRADRAANHTDN